MRRGAALQTPQQKLSLYRNIRRAHREHLPPDLRALGDSYVREEWKKHATAAPKFVPPFLDEWSRYLRTVKARLAANPTALVLTRL